MLKSLKLIEVDMLDDEGQTIYLAPNLPAKMWDLARDENKRLIVLEGKDALAQRLRNRLAMHKGEWYADESAGIDWLSVFDKPAERKRIEAAVIASLASDEFVTSIEELTVAIDPLTRTVSIDFAVDTELGSISGSVT